MEEQLGDVLVLFDELGELVREVVCGDVQATGNVASLVRRIKTTVVWDGVSRDGIFKEGWTWAL